MKKDVIVVGASAGGVDAIGTLLSGLPRDLRASVLVVMHLHPDYPSMLAQVLRRRCALDVAQASDGQNLRPGRVYVASPDRHLLLEGRRVRVIKGPRENLHRPAIDPLFRSAAYHYGSRVAGILLTGSDSDGTTGLLSIKMRGGVAIVQDPGEAAFPTMPRSALDHLEVDYVVGLKDMPPLLRRLTEGKGVEPWNPPAEDNGSSKPRRRSRAWKRRPRP